MTSSATSRPGSDLLARHQRRREQGIPTVTLLAGPTGLCVRRWRTWAGSTGRDVAMTAQADARAAVESWLAALATCRDLLVDALTWLAGVTGQATAGLRARLDPMTSHDLGVFWAALSFEERQEGPAAACRAILSRHTNGQPVVPGLAGEITSCWPASGDAAGCRRPTATGCGSRCTGRAARWCE